MFSWGNSTNITNDDQQKYAAHSLGLIGSSMYFGSGQDSSYLGPVSDPSNSSARTINKDDTGWSYRLVDSSTDGKTTVITNRTVSSTFECKFYNVSSIGDEGYSDIVTVKDWPGVDQIFVGQASPGASNYLVRRSLLKNSNIGTEHCSCRLRLTMTADLLALESWSSRQSSIPRFQ